MYVTRFCFAVLLGLTVSAAAAEEGAVKVFVLAGQSNMEGHGRIVSANKSNDGQGSLERLAKGPDADPKFAKLVDANGEWAERDDVKIWYLGRTGNLRAGFGVREDRIGPELGFGQVVGDAFEEPVLLIKLAWGGKSLGADFRPPSSGGEVGPYYKEVIEGTKKILSEAPELFPELKGKRLELTGFGWHQGWNDRVNQAFNDEYEKNLANFIRDVRKDLEAPGLPFVVAETGMSGLQETHPRALSLMKAQAAVAEYEEFRDNVAFVGTRAFFRPAEESPSGQAYHWNENAETYYLIGEAMGQATLRLLQKDGGNS